MRRATVKGEQGELSPAFGVACYFIGRPLVFTATRISLFIGTAPSDAAMAGEWSTRKLSTNGVLGSDRCRLRARVANRNLTVHWRAADPPILDGKPEVDRGAPGFRVACES
jgi:hypothetical protein